LLVGAALDIGEKIGKFGAGNQRAVLVIAVKTGAMP
jgi:hypothetical protein